MKIYIVTKEGYYTGLSYHITGKNLPKNSTTIEPPHTEEGYIARYSFEKKEWCIISSEDKEQITKHISQHKEENNKEDSYKEKIDNLEKMIKDQQKQIDLLSSSIHKAEETKKEIEKSFGVFCSNIEKIIETKLKEIQSSPSYDYSQDISMLKKELESLKTRMRLKF